MKKKHVNKILFNHTKRKNTVLAFGCVIFIFFIFTLSFLLLFIKRNEVHYVSFNEKNNTDYKVYLKDNNFYKDPFLDEDDEYISMIIDYINTNFKYSLSLDDNNVEYKYSYKIDADLSVKRKSSNNYLYHDIFSLIERKEVTTNNYSVEINENIIIDYNYYNDIIRDFINTYFLDDVSAKLTLRMHIKVIGSCEEFTEVANKESVISLDIPLASKVTNIELTDNLMSGQNNIIQCKKIYDNAYMYLFFSILFMSIDLIFVFVMVRYIYKTRSAENIYERKLRKILNNYGSYIQKLNNNFDFREYQLLKIDTFTDMLEIRDTIGQPILMKENNKRTGAYFVIPSVTKILYVYRLKISDIEKEINDIL